MSKAFTRDDDAAAEPVVLPPRAPLPDGVKNYVTPRGLQLLRTEAQELEQELQRERSRAAPGEAPDATQRRNVAVLTGRLHELEARLCSAVLVDGAKDPPGEVRFGAAVTVRTGAGDVRTYSIVGVDEARALGPGAGCITFVAPLARALIGRRVHDVVPVKTPRGEEELEILAVAYPTPAG